MSDRSVSGAVYLPARQLVRLTSRIIRLAAVHFLLCACLLQMAAIAGENQTGLNSPFGYHPASVREFGYADNGFKDALNIGVRWHRGELYAMWFMIQKDLNSDAYDFSPLDGQFGQVPPGIHILANIAPQSFFDEGRCLPGSWLPTDVGKYQAFVRAIVERYDGDGAHDMPGLINPIHYWQVGNEPNMAIGNTPLRKDFAELQRITYEAIKAADPRAKVLLAGVGGPPENFIEGFDAVFVPILEKLQGRFVDVFDLHWYGRADGDYRLRDKRTGEDVLEHVRMKLKASGFPSDLPIWFTEMGTYSGKPPGPIFPLQTERQQAADCLKRYIYPLSRGVEKVFLAWGLMEHYQPQVMHGYFSNTGIIYDGKGGPEDLGMGVKKLAYYTYKKMTEYLDGVDWSTVRLLRDGTKTDYIYLFQMMREGQPIYIAWRDCYEDSGNPVKTAASLTLSGLSGNNAIVTNSVPTAETGAKVRDYASAFTKQSYPLSDGSVLIGLAEDPVYIEIKR